VSSRHADYYLALAEAVGGPLGGQLARLARLEDEHDNLRAALAWLCETEQAEQGLRLVGALQDFWFIHSPRGGGRRWTERLAARVRASAPTAARARGLDTALAMAILQGDYTAAGTWGEQSVRMWRELGEPPGLARALFYLGDVRREQGDYAGA